MALTPQLGASALERGPLYFAGTAAQRLADLHAAFADETTSAVMCLRGGYGSNYLLDGLDLDLIRKHPKPFFAYSDLTGVQLRLLDRAGLPAFHGPMLAADFYLEDGVHLASFQAALAGEPYSVGAAEGLRALKPGTAQRQFSTAAASAFWFRCWARRGSRRPKTSCCFLKTWAPSPTRSIACCGNCARRASWRACAASSLARCWIAFRQARAPELLDEAILSALDGFEGPIAIGLRSGHVSRQNVTLTFGVEAELTVGDRGAIASA